MHSYEWTKRMKFLLSAIYGSPSRIQTALKPLEKIKNVGKTILGVAESFKTMNRPGLNLPDRNALWRVISWKVKKIGKYNFCTIFIKVLNLCY